MGQPEARRDSWRVVQQRWDSHIAAMDPGGKHRIVNGLSALTGDLAPAALAFLEAHRAGDIKETAAQAAERLRLNAANAERIAAELPAALDRVAQRV
jgi:hypothetical protein